MYVAVEITSSSSTEGIRKKKRSSNDHVSARTSKAGDDSAFAALFRVMYQAFAAVPAWHDIMWWLAVITMIGGNLFALGQRSLKRMLAYSSVAHAGYLLVAVTAGACL